MSKKIKKIFNSKKKKLDKIEKDILNNEIAIEQKKPNNVVYERKLKVHTQSNNFWRPTITRPDNIIYEEIRYYENFLLLKKVDKNQFLEIQRRLLKLSYEIKLNHNYRIEESDRFKHFDVPTTYQNSEYNKYCSNFKLYARGDAIFKTTKNDNKEIKLDFKINSIKKPNIDKVTKEETSLTFSELEISKKEIKKMKKNSKKEIKNFDADKKIGNKSEKVFFDYQE